MLLNQNAHGSKPPIGKGVTLGKTGENERKGSGGGFDGQELFLLVIVRSFCVVGVRAAGTTGLQTGAESFVHDLLDRPRTTAALGTAAQTAIHLSGRARKILAGHRASHVVIGDDVAGTNDHGEMLGKPCENVPYRYVTAPRDAKPKRPISSYSKLGCQLSRPYLEALRVPLFLPSKLRSGRRIGALLLLGTASGSRRNPELAITIHERMLRLQNSALKILSYLSCKCHGRSNG